MSLVSVSDEPCTEKISDNLEIMLASYFFKISTNGNREQLSTRICKISQVGNGPHKSTATNDHDDSCIGIGIIGAGWWWSNVVWHVVK